MTLRHLLEAVQRCHLVLHPFELTVPVEPYLMLKNLMEHEFTKELDAEFVGDYMFYRYFEIWYDCAEGGALYFNVKIHPNRYFDPKANAEEDQLLDVGDVLPRLC